MDFGKAVNICKAGRSIRRRGWNGKDQFVFYVPEAKMFPNTKLMMVYSDNGLITFRDFLAMKTVDGTIVPWVASQSDLLADDWECYFKKAEKPKQNPLKNFPSPVWYSDDDMSLKAVDWRIKRRALLDGLCDLPKRDESKIIRGNLTLPVMQKEDLIPASDLPEPEPWKDFNPFPWFKDGYLTPSSPITCSSNKDHQLDAFSYGMTSPVAKKPTREELQKKVMDELVGKIADKNYELNSSESSLAGKLLGIVTQKKGIGFPVPPDEAYTSYNSLIDWMNVNVQAID